MFFNECLETAEIFRKAFLSYFYIKAKLSQKKSFLELLACQKLLVKFVISKTERILMVANNLQPVTKILKHFYKLPLLY